MHADVYAKAAEQMLAGGAFSPADQDRLAGVQALLGMEADASKATLQALTSPLYTATVDEVIAELASADALDDRTSALQAGKLAARQQELLIGGSDATALTGEAMRAKAKETLGSAVTFLRACQVAFRGRDRAARKAQLKTCHTRRIEEINRDGRGRLLEHGIA